MSKFISEVVRDAVKSSGHSPYRVQGETGVDQLCVKRFLEGCGLNSTNLDKLADSFGITAIDPGGAYAASRYREGYNAAQLIVLDLLKNDGRTYQKVKDALSKYKDLGI